MIVEKLVSTFQDKLLQKNEDKERQKRATNGARDSGKSRARRSRHEREREGEVMVTSTRQRGMHSCAFGDTGVGTSHTQRKRKYEEGRRERNKSGEWSYRCTSLD